MVLIFVDRADALTIDQKKFQWLPIMGSLEHFSPTPKTFSARINGRSNTKATLIPRINDHSVEQEWLTSSILACYANNANRFIDSWEKLASFFANQVLLARWIEMNHMNWLTTFYNLVNLDWKFWGILIDGLSRLRCILRVHCCKVLVSRLSRRGCLPIYLGSGCANNLLIAHLVVKHLCRFVLSWDVLS